MKRFRGPLTVSLMALVALGLGGVAYVDAAEEKEDKEDKAVIEGEMVDMKCWVSMNMPGGGKHNKCAIACATKGIPAGVVDSRTGQVFTILLPAPGLAQ